MKPRDEVAAILARTMAQLMQECGCETSGDAAEIGMTLIGASITLMRKNVGRQEAAMRLLSVVMTMNRIANNEPPPGTTHH